MAADTQRLELSGVEGGGGLGQWRLVRARVDELLQVVKVVTGGLGCASCTVGVGVLCLFTPLEVGEVRGALEAILDPLGDLFSLRRGGACPSSARRCIGLCASEVAPCLFEGVAEAISSFYTGLGDPGLLEHRETLQTCDLGVDLQEFSLDGGAGEGHQGGALGDDLTGFGVHDRDDALEGRRVIDVLSCAHRRRGDATKRAELQGDQEDHTDQEDDQREGAHREGVP